MFKFLGIDPPPKKKTKIDSKEPNKQYDQTKRKGTIIPSCRQEFGQWLITDVSR